MYPIDANCQWIKSYTGFGVDLFIPYRTIAPPYPLTSDHRVAGSNPAGCKASTTTTYTDEQRPEELFAWTLLGHFLKNFTAAKVLSRHLRTAFLRIS